MLSKKDIEQELVDLNTMLNVVETYQEIAALRMQKTRSRVLKTREYLDGLAEVLQQVKVSYGEKKFEILREAQIEEAKKSEKKKEVAILLSANTMLYGDVIRKIFNLFEEYIKDKDVDLAIVGKVGLRAFKELKINKKYEYFDIPDKPPEPSDVESLLSYVIQYDNVSVFYSRFMDMLNQDPHKTTITGDISQYETFIEKGKKYDILPGAAVLYEPSVEDILDFFNKEILTFMFEQIVLEASLSKFAARMITLDAAVVNTKDRLKKTDLTRQKIKHLISNKKQLGGIAGYALWE